MSLSFIRTDLLNLAPYTANPHDNEPDLIRLDANESPLNLPAELKIKLASLYEQAIPTNRYPDASHWQLKNLITDYINESAQSSILTANISVGNGSDELIRSVLIATCLNQNGSILVAHPTFSMYAILAESLGIPVVSLPRQETDFSIDLELAHQAITTSNNPPIKVVFMVHPNSPTANCLKESEINWLKQLPDDILVVIDEAYYEFSQQTLVKQLREHPNWLILRTFSKAFRLAAHRVGYAIASAELIEILEKIRLPYNLPTFSQLAVKVALENRQLILPAVQQLMREKERVYQALRQTPIFTVWHSDANFIYLRLTDNPTSERHEQIRQKLHQAHILIRHTGGGLRISLGTEAENNQLLDQLTSWS
jgi:histidinol-phosphate aminotransferase